MNMRGTFPCPDGSYIDPTAGDNFIAHLLWWFAYDVNNPAEAGFMADHEYGRYMPFVYAALQRFQWLANGPGETAPGAWKYWEIHEPELRVLWLKQVAEFLPWLWD